MLLKKEAFGKMYGVYTAELITAKTPVFTYEDWIKDEKKGWVEITVEELMSIDKDLQKKFLRYGYDRDFGKIIGTFDYRQVKHISNFLNHSCNPNLVYSENDTIIAKRDIQIGEELTLDYGSFIVNVDQDFTCKCNSYNCREKVTKDDWRMLHENGMHYFPEFINRKLKIMHPKYSVMQK
ncbi:MAG: SET domain-containing protein-lysine N-methyltransferase [Spirochaetia bacterium]|nr:SET domain-containing protein-lysine N-methyltransferase [Spirochaetia bacterium]